jgi:hypothetical protein
MPKQTVPGSEEVTFDGSLRESLKKIEKELDIAGDLVTTMIDKNYGVMPVKFYRALKKSLFVAFEYVHFSARDYLREGG